MKIDMKNLFFDILGLFYIFLFFIAVINAFQEFNIYFVLWFCYLGMLLIGLGILFKKDYLIVSQLNILAIPMIIWTSDFLYVLIFGGSLFGITNYFFEQSSISNFISLQHLFTLPFSLLVLGFIKMKRNDYWKLSLIQAIVFYLVIYLFVPVENNINCVFKFCGDIQTNFLYPVIWFVVVFAIIFLTNWILSKFFYKK